MTPQRRADLREIEAGGAAYRDLVRQMGRDGWLGVGWPKEYGGQGRTPLEQLIFYDEAQRAGVPMPLVTLNTVGPTLMRFGTDEQKEYFLPRILAGELHFAIGYSEPGAGTDLASLRTRAVRDGDEYVINGQKVFTTGGHDADFVWLACRTDPDAPKHKGISILLVDTKRPGFKHSPIHLMGGGFTNVTYYEDMRVPVDRAGRRGERRLEDDHHPAQPRAGRARAGRPDRRPPARGPAMGERHASGRRPPGDRGRVGTDRAGARVRQGRGGQARQLAGGVGPDRRRAQPGRRVGDEGVRHRAAHRGGPSIARSARRARATCPMGRRARCCAATSSAPTAPPRSGRSAAASTRSQREIVAMVGLGMPRAPR